MHHGCRRVLRVHSMYVFLKLKTLGSAQVASQYQDDEADKYFGYIEIIIGCGMYLGPVIGSLSYEMFGY